MNVGVISIKSSLRLIVRLLWFLHIYGTNVATVATDDQEHKCIALRFLNHVGGKFNIVSTMKPEGYSVTTDEYKLKTIFRHSQLRRFVIFHGASDDKKDILLDGEKSISVSPQSNCEQFSDVIVTAQPGANTDHTPVPSFSETHLVPTATVQKQPDVKSIPQDTKSSDIPEVKETEKRGCHVTHGGNAGGACCHFPFVYHDAIYDRCTKSDNKIWCGTTIDYDRDKQWGYCQDCINTEGGKGDSECCQLPFMYKGKLRHHCMLDNNSKPWCSLTNDYDKDGVWGYCSGKNLHITIHAYATDAKPTISPSSTPTVLYCPAQCQSQCTTACPQTCCSLPQPVTYQSTCPDTCKRSCIGECPVKCCPDLNYLLQHGQDSSFQGVTDNYASPQGAQVMYPAPPPPTYYPPPSPVPSTYYPSPSPPPPPPPPTPPPPPPPPPPPSPPPPPPPPPPPYYPPPSYYPPTPPPPRPPTSSFSWCPETCRDHCLAQCPQVCCRVTIKNPSKPCSPSCLWSCTPHCEPHCCTPRHPRNSVTLRLPQGANMCPVRCRISCSSGCPWHCCFTRRGMVPRKPQIVTRKTLPKVFPAPRQIPFKRQKPCPLFCRRHCTSTCPPKCCIRSPEQLKPQPNKAPTINRRAQVTCPGVCKFACVTQCPPSCCVKQRHISFARSHIPLRITSKCPAGCRQTCKTHCPWQCCKIPYRRTLA